MRRHVNATVYDLAGGGAVTSAFAVAVTVVSSDLRKDGSVMDWKAAINSSVSASSVGVSVFALFSAMMGLCLDKSSDAPS